MRTCSLIALTFCVLVFTGCSGMPVMNSTASNPVQGVALQGRVHGGQGPISGASVYLLAANTSGYGNASASLLNSSGSNTHFDGTNYYVTTDSGGNFTITGDYTCPAATTQVYLYSIGGNSGSGTNTAAGLMAALGTCQNLMTSTFAMVNEISTVATAYSIAGYATDATHVSSSGSTLALTGVANAFATAQNLETLGTGVALFITPGTNGTAPGYEINTLADILAACVNSSGSTASGMPCNTLFTNAKNSSGTQPTDTATAAINIAHNPGANVDALFGLASATSPFQSILPAAPNDWTVGIDYLGCSMSITNGLAVDKSGNVWIAATNSSNASVLCEFSPLGVPASSTGYSGGGLLDPFDVAIDSGGNVWVTNQSTGAGGSNSISKFSPTGSPISPSTGYTDSQLSDPWGIAIDKNGNVWIADSEIVTGSSCGNGCTISEYSSSGSNMSGSPYTGGGLFNPITIAVDTSNNIWIASGDGAISKFNSSGTAISGTNGYSGGGLTVNNAGSGALAIDASGNVWSANNGSTNLVGELNSTGGAVSPSGGYTGGDLELPDSIAIDGSGHVWVANSFAGLSEFSSTGTVLSPNGFTEATSCCATPVATGIGIDGSGNIWISNNYRGQLSEVVGAAAPVVTPIVANLLTPYGSYAVNEP